MIVLSNDEVHALTVHRAKLEHLNFLYGVWRDKKKRKTWRLSHKGTALSTIILCAGIFTYLLKYNPFHLVVTILPQNSHNSPAVRHHFTRSRNDKHTRAQTPNNMLTNSVRCCFWALISGGSFPVIPRSFLLPEIHRWATCGSNIQLEHSVLIMWFFGYPI